MGDALVEGGRAPAGARPVWRDPTESVSRRVADLITRMTSAEKRAQLGRVRLGADSESTVENFPIAGGAGWLIRGAELAESDPDRSLQAVAVAQERIRSGNRFGIPALVVQEWTGAAPGGVIRYPSPLSWGASFDTRLARRLGAEIGTDLRLSGVHQLALPDPEPELPAAVSRAWLDGLLSAGVAPATPPPSGGCLDDEVARVLTAKCRLGLLDPPPSRAAGNGAPAADAAGAAGAGAGPELDRLVARAVAGTLAQESLVLLANSGVLPLPAEGRVAVLELGTPGAVPSVAASLAEELPRLRIGTGVQDVADAEAVVLVLAGAAAARDPALGLLLDCGRPVVVALGQWAPEAMPVLASRSDAVLLGFDPGSEGGRAMAAVLSGRVSPSGRLPLPVPGTGESPQHAELFPHGFGLSYTEFRWERLTLDGSGVPLDTPVVAPRSGSVLISCTVRNVGTRAGAEVVQLYLRRGARPPRLLGFARVPLEAGSSAPVSFRVPVASVCGGGENGAGGNGAGGGDGEGRGAGPAELTLATDARRPVFRIRLQAGGTPGTTAPGGRPSGRLRRGPEVETWVG